MQHVDGPDLENAVLSEASQRKTDIVRHHLYAEPPKTNTNKLNYKTGSGVSHSVMNSHSGGLLSSVTPAPTRWCTSASVEGSCCLALGSDRHCLSVQTVCFRQQEACTPSSGRADPNLLLWWLVSSEEIMERQ